LTDLVRAEFIMKISIIVPVYNEEKTVLEMLRRVQAVDLGMAKEIIVVDDGSTDGTTNILKKLTGVDHPPTNAPRVIFQGENRGKGSALRCGFQEARGDIIAVQDADLEYHPQELPSLIAPILQGQSRIVYGARFLRPHQPRYKLFYKGNRLISWLFGVIYGVRINDPWTGYKVFRREVLTPLHLTSQGFDLEIELTAKWLKAKEKIIELPISYQGRTYQEGKKIKWTDGIRALWAIIKYRFI